MSDWTGDIQAERTAIKAYVDSHGTGTHQMFLNGAEAGWAKGRDYGRERERALLNGVIGSLRILQDRGIGSPEACERATVALTAALAVSQPEVLSERSDTEPGEPEGPASIPGYANGGNPQPDHGPGEPSEKGALREALVLMAMAHEGSLIDEAFFEERYGYMDRGLLEAVRMAPTEDYGAHLTKAGLEFIRTVLAGESNE